MDFTKGMLQEAAGALIAAAIIGVFGIVARFAWVVSQKLKESAQAPRLESRPLVEFYPMRSTPIFAGLLVFSFAGFCMLWLIFISTVTKNEQWPLGRPLKGWEAAASTGLFFAGPYGVVMAWLAATFRDPPSKAKARKSGKPAEPLTRADYFRLQVILALMLWFVLFISELTPMAGSKVVWPTNVRKIDGS